MPLHTFTGVSRVKITDEEHALVGKTGKVVRRVRMSGNAWVRMDEEPPKELRSFEDDDRRGRKWDVVLFPDACEAI